MMDMEMALKHQLGGFFTHMHVQPVARLRVAQFCVKCFGSNDLEHVLNTLSYSYGQGCGHNEQKHGGDEDCERPDQSWVHASWHARAGERCATHQLAGSATLAIPRLRLAIRPLSPEICSCMSC
jgi:hypothetical protein